MGKPKYVDIENEGLRGQCLETALPAWQRNGWTVVDDGSSESGTEPVVSDVDTSGETDAKPVTAEVVDADDNEGGDQ